MYVSASPLSSSSSWFPLSQSRFKINFMLTRVILASSTHLDLHHERMARSALESGARQIRKKYVPLLIEHDFDRQIGVLLNAKVAKLPDGEYGLFAVAGEFENANERITYKNGERNTVHERYVEELEGIEDRVSLSPAESLEVTPAPRNLNIAEQLAIHLPLCQPLVRQSALTN